MLKYTILCHHLEYDGFLNQLYQLGVLHIVEKDKEEVDNYKKNKLGLQVFEKSLKKIALERNITLPVAGKIEPGFNIIAYVKENEEKINDFEKKKEQLNKKIGFYNTWEDFDLNNIEKINKLGISIKFFQCNIKKFKEEWLTEYPIEIISQDKTNIYFVYLSDNNEEINLPALQVEVPEKSLYELNELIKEINIQIEEINSDLNLKISNYLYILNDKVKIESKELDYNFVNSNITKITDEKVILLEGWVPKTKVKEINAYLEKEEFVYFSEPPGKHENVPILLKNNKFSKLFEPIGKLFSLPDYQELDLTPFFAPFFMLFFGFCLGDAGYGIIFIVLALFFKRKVKPELKPILTLAFYLGIATVLFGIISGTLFGINLIDTGYTITENTLAMLVNKNIPNSLIEHLSTLKDVHFISKDDFIKAISDKTDAGVLKNYQLTILKFTEPDYKILNSFRYLMQDSKNMFYLSLVIGGIQIIFGMFVKMFNLIKQKGFKYSLSTFGWAILPIILIVFIGGDKLNLLSLEKTKTLMYIFMAFAGTLIIFFNNPDSSFFLRPLNAIWDAYGMVTGIFGDLLSYIRLFALGVSSAILGFVFNDISSQFLSIKYFGWIPFVLLLAFGHSINIFLAALGGFIHPMRLTFVEFYKNAGFTGGGKEYKPFKNKNN